MRNIRAGLTALAIVTSSAAFAEVPKPAALTADGVPAVPDALAAATPTWNIARPASAGGTPPIARC